MKVFLNAKAVIPKIVYNRICEPAFHNTKRENVIRANDQLPHVFM